jgi:hypothetical protein
VLRACCLVAGEYVHADFGIGTFARVWLVRLANARPEDRDKVFALKVLRKVDGASTRQISNCGPFG